MNVKSMFKTRTFWFNTIGAVVELAQLLGGVQIVPAGTVTIISNVGNIILRRLTEKPASFSAPLN